MLIESLTEDGRRTLAAQLADGTAPPQVLTGRFWPSSWNLDGRHTAAVALGTSDIFIVTVENSKASARPLFDTPHTERWPEFSPWHVVGVRVERTRAS